MVHIQMNDYNNKVVRLHQYEPLLLPIVDAVLSL